MTATRKWAALAVLLVAAIFVASWFLLIGPKRSDAAALRSQKVEQDAKNQSLIQQQEAFLAQIRRQLPDNPALPTLIRNLTSAAGKSGVELTSLTPELPVAVLAPVAVVAAPTATTAPADEGSAAPAPVAAPPAPTLYQVPITVKTSGSYFETEQFLNKLEGLKRSFLVTGFSLKSVAPVPGEPAGLALEIKGRVFLSPAAASTAASATAPAVTSPTTAPAAN
jgi:type IV pilus assembly protein PilO